MILTKKEAFIIILQLHNNLFFWDLIKIMKSKTTIYIIPIIIIPNYINQWSYQGSAGISIGS